MDGRDVEASELPPAGWYRDPARPTRLRWWDGSAWTSWVAEGQAVTEEALPPAAAKPSVAAPRFPARAAWLAVGALLVGAFASLVVGSAVYVVGGEAEAASIVAGGATLYAVFVAAVVIGSKVWGTGRVAADIGLRFEWADAGWGPLTWISMFAAAVAIGIALEPFPHLQGSNTDALAEDPSTATVAALILVAVAAAPVFEELLFRGLLLGALRSALPGWAAIAVQAALFGLVHVQPDEGLGNVGLVLSLGAVGVVLGLAVYRAGRLGPAIIGHSLFNGVATIATLATT